MNLLAKLMPFYLGIFLGYLTFRDPDNAWVYGVFGGAFILIMILEERKQVKDTEDGEG
jgi:hypothetical protein